MSLEDSPLHLAIILHRIRLRILTALRCPNEPTLTFIIAFLRSCSFAILLVLNTAHVASIAEEVAVLVVNARGLRDEGHNAGHKLEHTHGRGAELER